MIHVLIALGLAAGYALFLLAWPGKACGSCARHPGRLCPRCGGTGRRFRPGARLVHRGAATGFRYARERLDARARAKENAR